jgi:putative permease
MIELLASWYRRYLSDPQAVVLLILLIVGFTVIIWFGSMLTPVLAAMVIAYLLDSIVSFMERRGSNRLVAAIIVSLGFVAFLVFLIFGMLPILSSQVAQLVREVPNYVSKGQALLMQLPQKHSFISADQVSRLADGIESEIATAGKHLLDFSLASIPGAITILVYLVLLPLLVFFFLKDKKLILNWISGFLPRERSAADQVWTEMDHQLGQYVRGKFWEIIIVGVVTLITFSVFGLKYAFLLSAMVGLSVLVPYIGATVVTIPVAVVAYFQWGWGTDFIVLVSAYLVIQALDGNLLVPLLFSEVVNLHPIAIIVSILIFGGLWGFWGVFFAIPLATLVNALLRAWPRVPVRENLESASPGPGTSSD